MKLGEAVASDEKVQVGCRHRTAKMLHRIHRKGLSHRCQLEGVGDQSRFPQERQLYHRPSGLRWCNLPSRLVGRHGGRQVDDLVEAELGLRLLHRQNVAEVNRIEGATE